MPSTIGTSPLGLLLAQNPPKVSNPELQRVLNNLWPSLQSISAQAGNTVTAAVFSTAANPGDAIDLYQVAGVLTARQADANTPNYANGFLLGNKSVAIGETGLISSIGTNNLLMTLTPGATYYLSNTPGKYSTAPGTHSQVLGTAISQFSIMFNAQVFS